MGDPQRRDEMAGSQTDRPRRAGHVAGLAVMSLVLGTMARAQVPGLHSPAPPGDARVQDPSPPLSMAGMPAAKFTEIVDTVDPLGAPYGPTTVPRPWCNPGPDAASTRVEVGIFDTITESVFGEPDPDSWRPLPLSALFREGWNEAWVPSPKGSGGAPRQGWINAVSGNLYRGWFFTFSQGFNDPPKSDAYLGSYTLMTPPSRRLMLLTNIPFVLRNNAESGQPINEPTGPTATTSRSHSGFGDISFTPRVLLHETKDLSLTAELAVLTPTGHPPLARKSALIPAVGFWTNFAGGWVIRGGIGDLIPTRGGGNTLISQLAVGQTLTKHDVPLFGDFTYYVSAGGKNPPFGGGPPPQNPTPGPAPHPGPRRRFPA